MKIGLIGKMCSGKTHVAKNLARRCALKKFAFADKLKEITNDLFLINTKDRKLLQEVGHAMRVIDPYVWINYLLYKIKDENRIIIDDIRYPNELEALRDNGFTIIKLNVSKTTQKERLMHTYPNTYQLHLDRLNHESEMHIDTMEADYIINSDKNVIENILKAVDPYYGKTVDSSSTITSSMF